MATLGYPRLDAFYFPQFYIGSLLLWKGTKSNFDALSCESIYGYDGTGNREYIVLDGQQRLTAIYYAFLCPDAPLPNRSNRFLYFIRVDKFLTEMYDEAFDYDTLTNRWSKLLKNRDAQFAEHIFPLSVIGAGSWDLPNWVQGYEQYWKDHAAKAKERATAMERKPRNNMRQTHESSASI